MSSLADLLWWLVVLHEVRAECSLAATPSSDTRACMSTYAAWAPLLTPHAQRSSKCFWSTPISEVCSLLQRLAASIAGLHTAATEAIKRPVAPQCISSPLEDMWSLWQLAVLAAGKCHVLITQMYSTPTRTTAQFPLPPILSTVLTSKCALFLVHVI